MSSDIRALGVQTLSNRDGQCSVFFQSRARANPFPKEIPIKSMFLLIRPLLRSIQPWIGRVSSGNEAHGLAKNSA